MTDQQKLAPYLSVGSVLVVLTAAAVLAVFEPPTMPAAGLYGLVGVIAGGTAVAGGIALTTPSTSTVPHLILIAAVLGLTVAMAVQHIFGHTEVTGVFAFILGGGSVGAGTNVMNTKLGQLRVESARDNWRPMSQGSTIGAAITDDRGDDDRIDPQ